MFLGLEKSVNNVKMSHYFFLEMSEYPYYIDFKNIFLISVLNNLFDSFKIYISSVSK